MLIDRDWISRPRYMQDAWNWLDFMVLLAGWLGFLIKVINGDGGFLIKVTTADASTVVFKGASESSAILSLRLLRVLRPLRSIRRLPGLYQIIATFMLSLARYTVEGPWEKEKRFFP